MPETIGIEIPGDDINTSGVNNVEKHSGNDIWDNLVRDRKANSAKLIWGYLNINSLAGKYD